MYNKTVTCHIINCHIIHMFICGLFFLFCFPYSNYNDFMFQAMKAEKLEREISKYKEKMNELDFFKSRVEVNRLLMATLR